jgi:hypothetical protein
MIANTKFIWAPIKMIISLYGRCAAAKIFIRERDNLPGTFKRRVFFHGGHHLRGDRFPIIRMDKVQKGLIRAAKIAKPKAGDPIQLV